ncbi:hypothetical protein KC669_04020 [Candidatus Dojkabacteria bacterium]|uniref:Uncharacterized protein n=1 Tax=Candidatus Dojkabacteria bacterium TaxID=2099670 RepID=A0A955LAW0_9BACT|nr:hypothetical protein [Candidatus Dojkabacteria bacterium]
MKKLSTKIASIFAIFFFVLFSAFPVAQLYPVAAQSDGLLCDIFPFLKGLRFASGLCTTGGIEEQGSSAIDTALQLFSFGVSLIFVGIIAVAIFVIIKSALKYIQSEGDESKVEEATKAIKNVFIGIGALIIGIIGLVIILSLANSSAGGELIPDVQDPTDILN